MNENKIEPSRTIVLDGEALRVEDHFHILGIENDNDDVAMIISISDQPTKYKNMQNSIGLILETKEDAMHLATLIMRAAEEIFNDKIEVRH